MAAEHEGKYDLEERTAVFGEDAIEYCQSLKQDAITKPLITQLVKCATSIGANYAEANNSVSKKDFRNKVGISRKESRETMFFLRMLSKACPDQNETSRVLWKEAKELNLILSKIFRSSDES